MQPAGNRLRLQRFAVYAGRACSIRSAMLARLSTSSARLASKSQCEPVRINWRFAELESIGLRTLREPLALTNRRTAARIRPSNWVNLPANGPALLYATPGRFRFRAGPSRFLDSLWVDGLTMNAPKTN